MIGPVHKKKRLNESSEIKIQQQSSGPRQIDQAKQDAKSERKSERQWQD